MDLAHSDDILLQEPVYYPNTSISPAVFYAGKWSNEDNTYVPPVYTETVSEEDAPLFDPPADVFVAS